MKIMHIKIITLFIVGVVFTAGFIMGFGGYVFATKNYNSSLSNKDKGIINRDVGNLLIDYGYGGEVVNQVTEALAVGVTTDGLRTILSGTSARSPAVVEEVLQKLEVELDRLGMGSDAPEKEFTEGAVPSAAGQPGAGQIEKEVSALGTGDTPQPETVNAELHRPPTAGMGEQRFKSVDGLDSETRTGILYTQPGERVNFEYSTMKSIQDLKAAESEEQRENIRKELRANRQTLQENVQTLRQDLRENAQELRENFRTEYLKYELKDVRVVSFRIALAHGKGLRMINRYRSAIARFDHIFGRLESRIEKIGIEIEMQAEGNITRINRPGKETIALIEEAKNTQVLNKAKLAELEAKYESLLLGKNSGGVAKEARAIAKELKSEIEKLHGLLDDIRQATGTINTTKSNTF